MTEPSPRQWLLEAIEQATRSSKFCVAGCLPKVDPGLEVTGLGYVAMPLKPGVLGQFMAYCQDAPYGKGTETLVDKRVRKTFELNPEHFRLSEQWNSAISDVTKEVATQLELPPERFEAKLYKLLVYEKGGFFLPHRDSEKLDRMLGSLVVVLPNKFEGGALIVRHRLSEQKLEFKEAATGQLPCFAAFYADCEHEIQRVTRGRRIALVYNLILEPLAEEAPSKPPVEAVTEAIRSWIAAHPGRPLVFALEHHYTQRGLSLDLLKGADRELADLVATAAGQVNCLAHWAQVQRHLEQFADDGSFASGYRSRFYSEPPRKLQIGETYTDELVGTQWTNLHGQHQPWGEIEFDLSSIVASIPIEDWKPTSEEYEGYTGNAGNTLDRWYHRSAIVLWHRDDHFKIVASAGAAESIPLFSSMATELAKTPEEELPAARENCLRLARAIIADWSKHRFSYIPSHREAPFEEFPRHLLLLRDRDTVAEFLAKLAEEDPFLSLRSFVVPACEEFGWNALAEELKQLLRSQSEGQGIPSRDIEWLAEACGGQVADLQKAAVLDELCQLATDRFCGLTFPRDRSYRRAASDPVKSLPLLLKALVARGREEDLSRVIGFVQEAAKEFPIETSQVPALEELIPWSRLQLGRVPRELELWLDWVRQQLEAATAQQPQPPTDWARPAEVDCTCEYCAKLNTFLADPNQPVGRIAARADIRRHLVQRIDQHGCDVDYTIDKLGRPYSLVLTKANRAFERAMEQFRTDCQLLSTVKSLLAPG